MTPQLFGQTFRISSPTLGCTQAPCAARTVQFGITDSFLVTISNPGFGSSTQFEVRGGVAVDVMIAVLSTVDIVCESWVLEEDLEDTAGCAVGDVVLVVGFTAGLLGCDCD